jgi:hypothetical protein
MSPCRHLAMSPSRHVAISPCRHVASVATLMQARSRCTLNRAMLITTHALQSFGSTGTQGKKVINVPRADAFFCFKTFFIVLANPDARISGWGPGEQSCLRRKPRGSFSYKHLLKEQHVRVLHVDDLAEAVKRDRSAAVDGPPRPEVIFAAHAHTSHITHTQTHTQPHTRTHTHTHAHTTRQKHNVARDCSGSIHPRDY